MQEIPEMLLATVMAVALCHTAAHGGAAPLATAPPAALSNASQEFLDAHNQARAEVGVEPLTWSDKLAKATSLLVRLQRDKTGCKFADLSGGKYGANQLWASGLDVTPSVAVGEWVAEKNYYDHASNSCAPNHKCGVYTQVVWKKSLELGCAQASCQSVVLTICFYNPPGNVIGESPY